MLNSSLDALNISGDDATGDVIKRLKDKVKPIIQKRASSKRSLTRILNKLTPELDGRFILSQITQVREKLATISELDEKILEEYNSSPFSGSLASFIQDEEDRVVDYHYNMGLQLFEVEQPAAEVGPSQQSDDLVNRLSKALKHNAPKIHEIKLPLFRGTNSDVEYTDFITQFNNVIGYSDSYSPSTKLVYLKNQLRDEAYDVIRHLSNEDQNYDVAVQFLNKEYADRNVCIDRQLSRLFHAPVPQPESVEGTKHFLNAIRAAIFELKNLGYDPLIEDSFGDRALSFLLLEKLPRNFKSKLSTVLKTDYPSVQQILDNYHDILKSIEKLEGKDMKIGRRDEKKLDRKPISKSKVASFPSNFKSNHVTGSLQNFSTTSQEKPIPMKTDKQYNKPKGLKGGFKACKLCSTPTQSNFHSLYKCETYTTPEQRIGRCRELKLCCLCSGDHEGQCLGTDNKLPHPCMCGSRSHITALHVDKPNTSTHIRTCLLSSATTQSSSVLLPSISAIVYNKDKTKWARARIILDHGAQSSYVSSALRNKLCSEHTSPRTRKYTVKTFIGKKDLNFEVMDMHVQLTGQRQRKIEVLVDPDLDLNYEVKGVVNLINKLKHQKCRFADSFYIDQANDYLDNFDALLGSDVIPFIEPLKTVKLLNGIAYKIMDGVILFGDISNYDDNLISISSRDTTCNSESS